MLETTSVLFGLSQSGGVAWNIMAMPKRVGETLRSTIQSDHQQFQVQILITPVKDAEGGTEICVSGGIPKLPPINGAEGVQKFARDLSPNSRQRANNYHRQCQETASLRKNRLKLPNGPLKSPNRTPDKELRLSLKQYRKITGKKTNGGSRGARDSGMDEGSNRKENV
ncbi:hypothetical protein FQR65_LT01350 [Abscondita terminalis]|nr:hypothetical protein FQR65_LT01350 [Abscondita terminalis]